MGFLHGCDTGVGCKPLNFIACSQTSCAVLSRCFTECTCAVEITFFCLVFRGNYVFCLARATNKRTIILITNSTRIYEIHYLCMGTISPKSLRWKIEVRMAFENRLNLYSKLSHVFPNLLLFLGHRVYMLSDVINMPETKASHQLFTFSPYCQNNYSRIVE